MEVSPPQDSQQPAEPSTSHQPTIDQLTQELAQSTKRNKGYFKLIAELQDENKELRLQVKNIEKLHKVIILSHRTQQERRTLLKSQAKRLKFKSPASSKLKVAANIALPSS